MVDGVNFNPFTMKAWTAEEITELDTNGDKKISESEVKAKWSWLAGQDSEGDVAIGENTSDLTQAAKKAGMSDTANTPEELKSNISILADEYIEQYMTEHMELSDLERSGIQSLISTSATNFAAEYIAANPQGPYDMAKITEDFVAKMEQAITDNKNALNAVNASINGYKNNVDTNYESMLNYANTAMENKNVSNSEWNQVKNKAVQYLMGMLLNGQVDTDFMKSISPNYTKSGHYTNALNSINAIKNETDPIKIQQLLTQAQDYISKFLDSLNKTDVVKGIQEYAQAKEEAAITSKVSSLADNWIESNTTSSMTGQEKAVLKQFAESCVGKFVAKLAEENRMSGMNDKQIQTEFADFIEQKYSELKSIQEDVAKSAGEIETSHNTLISISDSAKSNGNISADEKAAIVNAATELVMKQLLSGMEDIPFMQSLNSNYKTSTDYKTLQGLITKINSSVDPDEIKELQTQAKELLTKILDSYSGDNLVNAVDSTKPVEVTGATKDKTIYNSAISNDYQANVSRTSSYGKQNDGSLAEIQNQARADMQAVAESLKAQLKAQLGTAYNETEIQKYINDAMNDTIAIFTQNVERTTRGKDYSVGNDKNAFVFLRKKGTKSGRYTYNLQALVNTFIQKFNETAKTKNIAKNDPAEVTYDKENVVTESVGNDYHRNTKVENEDRSALLAIAKAKLHSVAASIKASLIAEGSKVSSSDIDSIVDESMQETMNNFDFSSNSFNTKTLVDDFMSRVDTKLEAVKNKK